MDDRVTDPLIAALAGLIDPDKLMDEHRNIGGRCSGCRGGNETSARAMWPCNSYNLALRVQEIQQQSQQRRA